jgi:hypothetical protein
MRFAFFASVTLACLAAAGSSLAQNQLPTTVITAPKPTPKPKVPNVGSQAPTPSDANALPDHPDPTSRLRARDWNAPGVIDLSYMTDAQFVAFQAMHPTATFWGRCYMGQDPDPAIRFVMRRNQAGILCK